MRHTQRWWGDMFTGYFDIAPWRVDGQTREVVGGVSGGSITSMTCALRRWQAVGDVAWGRRCMQDD